MATDPSKLFHFTNFVCMCAGLGLGGYEQVGHIWAWVGKGRWVLMGWTDWVMMSDICSDWLCMGMGIYEHGWANVCGSELVRTMGRGWLISLVNGFAYVCKSMCGLVLVSWAWTRMGKCEK